MSSSSDLRATALPGAVVRAESVGDVLPLHTPELRTGQWTRHGDLSVLGDAVTEAALSSIAESARAAAQAQGYAVGWAEGRRDAQVAAAEENRRLEEAWTSQEARRAAEHRDAVLALEEAAEQLHALTGQVCTSLEEQATDLAWALVEEIIGREVSVASGADAVRRALALGPTGTVARVRLNPAAARDAATAALVERGIEVVSDPALGRIDALVESDGSVHDLRIDTAMERVREVLS